MSQRKQTARKTTGKHVFLSYALQSPPPTSKPRPRVKPVQRRPTTTSGTTGSRSKSTPLKSILKRPSAALSSPAPPPPTTSVSSSSSLDEMLVTPQAATASRTDPVGSLVTWLRPPIHVLDKPISVCTRFATWLESQTCVHEDALLGAVERDGSHFLSLAKATVAFDNALRGRVAPTLNDVASPLGEYARTLRVFAEHLISKISEGSLSKELETAVLRDGEALLRLALCCLEFDQAVGGWGDTAGS